MKIALPIIALVMAIATVTYHTYEPAQPPAPAPVPPPDPVALMKQHIANLHTQPKEESGTMSKWEKISYDVKKTDSLISPFVATIEATKTEWSLHPNISHVLSHYKFKVDLAFQDNKWVIKKLHERATQDQVGLMWDREVENPISVAVALGLSLNFN